MEGFEVKSYPNPSNNREISFVFDVKKYSKAKIHILDSNGSVIADLGEVDLQPGIKSVKYDINQNIKRGIYFIKITSDDSNKVLKQIIE